MKPQALFVTLVVFAAVLGALPPLAESQGRPNPPASPTPWPCCDDCGMCTRSFPPKCKCSDASPRGCHPACKDCVRSRSRGSDGTPLFVCNDLIENFCLRSCSPATTA